MKIEIEKAGDHYRADCKDLPGSPPVGLGETPELAIACLFYRMMFESTGGMDPKPWTTYIKQGEPIIVDGKNGIGPNHTRGICNSATLAVSSL